MLLELLVLAAVVAGDGAGGGDGEVSWVIEAKM